MAKKEDGGGAVDCEALPIQVVLNPVKYTRRVYALILEKCQEWRCSPAEAEARLLDEMAAKEGEQLNPSRC